MQATLYLRRLTLFLLSFLVVITAGFTALFFWVTAPPDAPEDVAETTINDVTQLNPIVVSRVRRPATIPEIRQWVAQHNGPVSIGGARHSMGGQTATEDALFIDMRSLHKIVSFSPESREITVQAGTTWRQIQECIDPHNLSVKVMQTYANFTVGGSLSVNAHGRYMGNGPMVSSVKSIRVVLADGSLVTASPTENADIFYGSIGGYGALGIIVEATLVLTTNCRVERRSQVMPLTTYAAYFKDTLRNDSLLIFHNADIYPDEFTDVRTVSYRKTEKPVTIAGRLKPLNKHYRMERFAMWVVSEAPFGQWMRRYWGDPFFYDQEQVKWRNYEASFDARELEPSSRKNETYVLQEYFVPTEQLTTFVPRMAAIFRKHHVNVINVSIRHARQDPGTLLAWARTEVFSLVVYYKQGTGEDDRQNVGLWTKALVDEALACGGSYYLPYQIHATAEQFLQAYPQAEQFFALKRRLDPEGKFRNKLWDRYYSYATEQLANQKRPSKINYNIPVPEALP